MISYVTVGADDIAAARAFYSALLLPLGYSVTEGPEGLSYTLPTRPELPHFYVKPPFNGAPATPGNGAMTAFEAQDQQQVRTLYAAALSAGGIDEGAPGFRASYGANFYVAYLRDPSTHAGGGNKIALYSSNPDDPTRDG